MLRPRPERAARLRGVALALTLLLLLPACVKHRLHRPQSIEAHPGFGMAFVEFDDHGELWAPSQVSRALERIRAGNRGESGIVCVIFVHGWNHDASPGDSNVEGFRRLLENVADGERRQTERPPRDVVGVYLGWRGRNGKIPLLRIATFFNRRAAAERIADVSATEVIYRLMKNAKRNPRSKCVLFGHSFGGMIVESALSQAIVGSLLETDQREIEFPADLVLLLNPASQSIKAKQLVEIMDRSRIKLYRTAADGHRYERPLIVSATSAGDSATRLFFPLGLRFKGLNKQYRRYGIEHCASGGHQRTYYARTAGHYRVLHSHSVSADPVTVPRQGPLPIDEIARGSRWEYDPETEMRAFVVDGSRYRFTIRQRPQAMNTSPYWIMELPPVIIPDHSRIFRPEMQEFVRALLVLTGALEDDSTTELVREDGVRPIALEPRPDGSVVFLDRSQQLYEITPGSWEPRFYACVPGATLNADEVIGVASSGDTVYVGRNVRGRGNKSGTHRTDVLRHELDMRIERQTRVLDDRRFVAAAFDVPGSRAFLALEGSATIGAIDMTRKKNRFEPLFDLGGMPLISELLYVPTGRQLFASDGLGTVVRLRTGAHPPEYVSTQMLWPTALAFDEERNRLYVTVADDNKIWMAECADRCFAPQVFTRSLLISNPTTLAVGVDGTLWVGDPTAQVILAFSPDGDLLAVVDRVP